MLELKNVSYSVNDDNGTADILKDVSLTIEDHRRMAMLYEKAENKIVQNGGEENEDLILSLAHEFLIENSTWYAYQKKNQPSLTFE